MQRTAILLRYGEELPIPEIAAALAVEETTVKTHLARGLARLRAEMGSNT
jgi:RNA polymerase sigma-70 factor (ECF subfamily)